MDEYEVTPAVDEVRDKDGNITTEAVPAVMGEREIISQQNMDQSKLVPPIKILVFCLPFIPFKLLLF